MAMQSGGLPVQKIMTVICTRKFHCHDVSASKEFCIRSKLKLLALYARQDNQMRCCELN